MAKCLSQVYTIIRGSVGGITYLSGRNNAIVVRARTAPVQPLTLAQQQMRSAWAGAEAAWRALTSIQRAAWGLYADLVVYSGPLGAYTITGRQRALATWALAGYLNDRFGEAITIGGARPVKNGWFLTHGHKLAAPGSTGTGFNVTVINDETEAAIALINVSQPVPETRNFWKGPWDDSQTIVEDIAADASTNFDIDGLNVDEKYFVRIRIIGDSTSKRFGEEVILNGIAATTV